MINAAKKIDAKSRLRFNRLLRRLLMNFGWRFGSRECTSELSAARVTSEEKKRSRHLRQRKGERPRTRSKASVHLELFDERISELPHLGQFMFGERGEYPLMLLRAYPKYGGFPPHGDNQDVAGEVRKRVER